MASRKSWRRGGGRRPRISTQWGTSATSRLSHFQTKQPRTAPRYKQPQEASMVSSTGRANGEPMKLSPHFRREEFACPCGDCRASHDPAVDHTLIEILEDIRTHFNKPIAVTSAYRCYRHNEKVGGKPASQHLTGRAADIIVRSHPSEEVFAYVTERWPDEFGFGSYATFTHIDSRGTKARW